MFISFNTKQNYDSQTDRKKLSLYIGLRKHRRSPQISEIALVNYDSISVTVYGVTDNHRSAEVTEIV